MNFLDRLIASVAPGAARDRLRARLQLQAASKALAHYDAASAGRRLGNLRASGSDADAAAARRARISHLVRDLVRNTPFAARAQQVITNNTIGDGIVPRIGGLPAALKKDALALIENVLDTTEIDAAGRMNLYGLQRLVMNALVDAGEALIVAEWQAPRPGSNAFPLKLRVLEADHLDDSWDHYGQEDGGWVQNGIRYDAAGRRVAYRLFRHHPGAEHFHGAGFRTASEWVSASQVLHIYRPDRPGQERGVSWFAPVVLTFLDHGDYQDAQILRQKIAAAFAGFRRQPDTTTPGTAPELGEIEAGLIYDLYGDEDIVFSNPPDVGGYDEFTRVTLRACAAALGITYEALTGDLSNVNFSSARMGRMEMDRNVSSWQWTILMPQMMQPLAAWILEGWAMWRPEIASPLKAAKITWVPPSRIIVDPAREIGALKEAVRAGFTSRQSVVRGFGVDPERLLEEQIEDQNMADAGGLVFDSDARHGAPGAAAPAEGAPQTPPAPDGRAVTEGTADDE